MDGQIQVNILADGILSDTFREGILYLIHQSNQGSRGEIFREALNRITINEELEPDLTVSGEVEASPYPPKRLVTFTASTSSTPQESTSPIKEPDSPYPVSAFAYDPNIETTRL